MGSNMMDNGSVYVQARLFYFDCFKLCFSPPDSKSRDGNELVGNKNISKHGGDLEVHSKHAISQ